MARSVEIEAFAKINIGLHIGGRMSDGYHPIFSVFHSVDLSDSLSIGEKKSRGIEIAGSFDCPLEATTIYRAASLFLRSRRLSAGLSIAVDKRIPVQAGLGGGSADAAAVLVGLDRLFPEGDGGDALADMASQVGADVPFFLSGGAAYVTGRGERVEKLVPRPDLGLLLLKPGFGMPTADAYRRLDAARARTRTQDGAEGGAGEPPVPEPLSGRPAAMEALGRDPAAWSFENDFAPLLFGSFPEYGIFMSALREAGADFVSLSGSGSCIYGVFDSQAAAASAQGRVEEAIRSVLGPKTLSGMALHAIKPLETSLVLR
jgi:4-diphosphocytidyl-2-C-methyl-D-erythritol kinase